ncbi:MAG: MarR family transcriptional regulator [Mycobacterium sp.]|nr:MarR family transcriptional regulator [Mycobacterium sp.]MCW2553968.1 MarR family transcriptional regulator [Mycobacterium sp.]
MAESTPDDVAVQRARIMEELRGYGSSFTEVSRRFAAWLSLHYTDAVALLAVAEAEQRGDPLSPARLSERVSLSSGATTALINRLEQAHHVVRSREHSDRRVVTLHTTEHVGALAEEYFGPLGTRLDAMMSKYPPEQLRQFETFVTELRNTMEEHLREQNSNL